ncbi:MAG: cytochrome c maturation protein CcmE [Coriobacteriia bacterium]|nr:cytochrome c maturation protein CcmE [Coriobacteriia bacterium]MCL2870940.1 cytochrome c maturation protein CcmE [Coriobacteriia bacterium]
MSSSRARNRLIGISAVLSIVVVAAVVFFFFNGTSLSLTVDRLYESSDRYVGETVQLSGTVVAGSWDRQSNPMVFKVFDEESGSEAEVTAVFEGVPPANFGDGTGVIITGVIEEDKTIVSSQMLTVCPSRYETNDNTLPVYALFDMDEGMDMTGIPVRVSARVVDGSITPPGEEIRLTVHDIENPSIQIPVKFSGGLADTVTDGTPVVLTGHLDEDGNFIAEIVANIADS